MQEFFMIHFDYVIVGGGMTADAAVSGIREYDQSGRIALFSEEKYTPYNRPLLTKGLWTGKPLDSIWRKTTHEKVSFYLEKKVTAIDVQKKEISTADGESFGFGKLLLATGGIPQKLTCPNNGVIYFRTLDDYYQLRALYEKGDSFAVIGSGFIGTEIAASLCMNGKQVTMIFQEPSIGSKKYPKKFSQFLNAYYTENGVQLVPEDKVKAVIQNNGKFEITTEKGKIFRVSGVIAGLGIEPNVTLAKSIGLTLENGIQVDSFLQTSQANIYAAGDVANFYSPILGKRIRLDHEDAANTMGKTAGVNMAGKKEEYRHLPFFYSDLFDLSYEAIGEISADLEMIEEWEDPYRKGIIYYLKEGRLRGAISWGIWDQIDKIREKIASQEFFTSLT